MARANTKQQLLYFGQKEFNKILEYSKDFSKTNQQTKTVFDNRTIKDVLAHLLAWHMLFLNWYTEGMKGNIPDIPSKGFTFKDTPTLNEKLYQDYRNISWEDVMNKLKTSHAKVMKLVKKHTEEELFTKKKYKWTGSTSMGSYFASATSSHYAWANTLFRKVLK